MNNIDYKLQTKTKEQYSMPLSDEIKNTLLKQRKIFLWGEINDKSCSKMMEEFLYLEAKQVNEPIRFYINSPGGSITAGMAIFDCIRLIQSPVYPIVTGMAASMASILLSAGEKGKRYVFPNARVLIHQPLIAGTIIAPATDINIHANEIEKQRHEINQILSEATGQSISKIEKDTDRDFYLNAKESIEYGLADKILNSI